MFMGNRREAALLNFLIDELNFAGIPFRFAGISPLEDAVNGKWYHCSCPVNLVSLITETAKSVNGSVAIACVEAGEDENSLFVEIVVDSGSVVG